MGAVPEDQFMMACECFRDVKRFGLRVIKFIIGDSVAVMRNVAYADRIRCPVRQMHGIPVWMSFTGAAMIPLVCVTALYGLYDLANLREGEVRWGNYVV